VEPCWDFLRKSSTRKQESIYYPGDLVIAFTDGVTEALNERGEEFGDERLKEFLRTAAGARAEDISSRLADTLREWIGAAEQHDDLTFVVVTVN